MMPSQSKFNRRAFLGASAVSVWTARSWASIAGANTTPRIAIVTGGSESETALNRLQSAQRDGACARLIAHASIGEHAITHPGVKTVERWQQLTEAPDLDAIVNAAPLLYRGAVTLAALQSGKDVYVMPPLAGILSEAIAAQALSAQIGRIIQVGVEQCTGRAWNSVGTRIASGNLGPIRRASASFHHDPRRPFLESLCEGIAPLVLATKPGTPESVVAAGGRIDGDTCKPPDMLTMTARFNDSPREIVAISKTIPGIHGAIRGEANSIEFDMTGCGHHTIMKDWIDAIATRQPAESNAEVGVQTLRIALAAIESYAQGKRLSPTT